MAAGDVIVQNDLVGVARSPIAANALGSLAVAGVFEFPKDEGVPLIAGVKVYWDATAKLATTIDGGGANKFVGKVIENAADTAATVRVRMSQ